MPRWFSHGGRLGASRPDAPEFQMFIDTVQEEPLFGHRQPASTLGGLVYCFLLVAYVVAVALSSLFISSTLCPALLSAGNVVLLMITGILQRYLSHQVKKERIKGFYAFSEKLKPVVHLPFAVVAYGTALMLLIISWQPAVHFIGLSVFTLLRIVIYAEIIWAGAAVGLYIWCMDQHNSMEVQPDVTHSLYSPLQPSDSLEELRYSDRGRLIEQQTALLQYQRENLQYLSEEILRLQECLSKYESSDNGNASQVDVLHLLSTREQELRTLSAERDQLQSELHLARSLMADRDSEIQQMRITNDQYIAENDRLRSMITEWSACAAKMERALENEQISKAELKKKLENEQISKAELKKKLENEQIANAELQEKLSPFMESHHGSAESNLTTCIGEENLSNHTHKQ